jgi:peptidoglycan/xylan/chitin deacetylase (PgdA/CDA1 family)
MKIDPLTALLNQHAGQHGPVMLMYHSVLPGKGTPAWPWAVSMQRFRDQLDFLASERYATPTMAELVTIPVNQWPARTAVITFDDGYLDNLAACEELQKRGMRATLFVVTGSVGKTPKWPADGRPEGRLLNAVELNLMQSCGMEIGSHTVNHVRLTEIDDATLVRELTESRATLEGHLGNPITSFAYPYGAWNEHSATAVKQAGYAAACTTRTGWALRDGDHYKLRRLTVFNTDTASSLARKLYLGDNNVDWGRIIRYLAGRLSNRIV